MVGSGMDRKPPLTCDWDDRPPVEGWQDRWKRPLCARCESYLLTLMQGPPAEDERWRGHRQRRAAERDVGMN